MKKLSLLFHPQPHHYYLIPTTEYIFPHSPFHVYKLLERMRLHTWLLSVFLCLTFSGLAQQINNLANCNVVWTSPSENAAGSMPVGGGDIGLNVWVEKGDVLFYLSRSGTFDENNQLLKLGRVRLQLSNNPFASPSFRQELKLEEGYVQLTGDGTVLKLWVDVFRPVVHLDIQSAKPTVLKASYESWRFDDHLITDDKELRANSYKAKQPFAVKTYKDSITYQGNELLFVHRNRADIEDIFDYTVRMEGMSSVKEQLFNPIKQNTFGGVMRGENMKIGDVTTGAYTNIPYKSWALTSVKPTRKHTMELVLHVEQSPTLAAWQDSLKAITTEAKQHQKTAFSNTLAWWKQFWNRSYVYLNSTDTSATALASVSRNYQLFRYQLACNAYGQWPTKFNGGLFAFDPVFVNPIYPFSPDFRLWGGGTMTAQNQRLVYFPMFKSGDVDMLKSQFDFYLKNQKNAELRSSVYWKHKGACFTEQIENFGLPNVTEYNPKKAAESNQGVEANAWLEYEWETVFEFCFMMLEAERYENKDIHAYIPFIESCLTFYDEHYVQLAKARGVKAYDEKGQYIFYPSSAAETFKMTYNSVTVISALQSILTRLLNLPPTYLDSLQREKYSTMLKRIPTIPLQSFEQHTTIAPAQVWARVQNSEAPQLYPVYPWGIYGIGKPDLETAVNTYRYDPHVQKYNSHVGWRQYNIFAARLGLAEEAARLTKLKFKDALHRFPTFWGPGFDWTPDHNWGGSAMIGLQEMLMQVDGKKIYLLPAFPKNWNARFKLNAPYQTTIEATVTNGKITQLLVTPKEREKDVLICP